MTFLVGAEHIWFLYLEMFLWTKPVGMKTFGMNQEQSRDTAVLAANQGLYNGFLTAGLYWGIYIGNGNGGAAAVTTGVSDGLVTGLAVQRFFLSCVVCAGVFGGKTVHKKLFYVQAVPALLALGLGFLGL